MTKQEWFEYHDYFCKKLREITAAKNADYTGGSSNPFDNFSSVERDSIASTETGFLVRMRDKFSRIISFTNQGTLQVKDESVQDTLMDLANYCILFSAYIESKKKPLEGPAVGNRGSIGDYEGIPASKPVSAFTQPEIRAMLKRIDK